LLAPEIIYFNTNFRVAGQCVILPGAARFVNTPACGAPGLSKKQKTVPHFDQNAN
jgi:hypothetical protein